MADGRAGELGGGATGQGWLRVRVMTYNIKNGGWDGADPGRLDRVLQVIAEQRPDVLAMQELRGVDRDRRRLDSVAERLGMRPYLARTWFGQPVAVLVRPPAEVSTAVSVRRPFHHAALRVVVDTDRGPLTVLGTHLHPYSGRRRLREAGWLVGAARRSRPGGTPLPDRLVLLMGDLNSLDPDARHDDRVARLPPRYRARHLMPDGATVDTRAIAALHRAGFVDLFRQSAREPRAEHEPPPEQQPDAGPAPGPKQRSGVGEEPPDTVPTSGGGGAEFTNMRLDYLLATPPLARLAQHARVVTGGAAESASDHYPLVAEFDLRFR